jgi:hypothetical protein
VKLPYSILPAEADAAFPERASVSRPIVALHLARDGKEMVVFAIVDSGADQCVFPASIAEALGIQIPNHRASAFSGSSQISQVAYFDQVQATILPMDAPNIEPGQEPLSFRSTPDFARRLSMSAWACSARRDSFPASPFALRPPRTTSKYSNSALAWPTWLDELA